MSGVPVMYDVRIDEERPVTQVDYDEAKRLADIFTIEHRMIRSIVRAADRARESKVKVGDWLAAMDAIERALAKVETQN